MRRAGRLVTRWGIGAAIYFVAVFVVSAATPARVLHPGDEQLNGEWGITVDKAAWSPHDAGRTCAVTLRLSNHGRGRPQRERGVDVYLVDAAGWRYEARANSAAPPLETRIAPQQSVSTLRNFDLPATARDVGLVVDHGAGLPGCLIITENHWFHKPPIVQLE